MGILLLFCLFTVSFAMDLKSLQQACLSPPVAPPRPLGSKFDLPTVYKVSGSLTNWQAATLALLTESTTSTTRTLQLQTRDYLPNRWISDLRTNSIRFINGTSSTCNGNSSAPELIQSARLRELLNNQTSNLSSLIRGIVDLSTARSGFLKNEDPQVVGGEETVTWYSCINATNTSTAALVEVRYAGESTVRPAVAPFSNPLIMSIRLAEFNTFNDTNPLSHVSVEFDRFELPGDNEDFIPHGVFCSNQNATEIPVKLPEEFGATVTYLDTDIETSEIFYSTQKKLLIVSGDRLDKKSSLLNATFPSGTKLIVHDFAYGYEYALTDLACISISTLPNTTLDVVVTNQTLSLKPLGQILLDSSLNFVQYSMGSENVQNLTGFRAQNQAGEVVEVCLDSANLLVKVDTYSGGKLKRSMRLAPTVSSLLSRSSHMADCFRQNTAVNNSTWSVELAQESLYDVYKTGLLAVQQAIAAAINSTVVAFNPHRLTVFWSESPNGKANGLLRLSEKSEVQPANVAGGSYQNEPTSQEIFQKLNQTISAKKFKINLVGPDGKPQEWALNPTAVSVYPQQTGGSFVGYSGGSMFVLAIFTFLFGVGIGAGGVFFVSKRQGISTLAYQVFE